MSYSQLLNGLWCAPYGIETGVAPTTGACTVELCRNPLHPGPCKGWKNTPAAPKLRTPKAPPAAKPLAPTTKTPTPPKASPRVAGRDVTGDIDYAAVMEMRSSVFGNDERLSFIAAMQGFDGKPELVSTEDFDNLTADGTAVLYRGLQRANGFTGPQLAQQFRDGDAYYGSGVYGNGIYTTPVLNTARFFAGRNNNGVVRMALRPDAKTITLDEANQRSEAHREGAKDYYAGQRKLFEDMLDAQKNPQRQQAWTDWQELSEQYESNPAHHRNLVLADPSAWAMANGYDAIILNGPARKNGKPEDQVIVLNRTAVVAEDPKLGVAKPTRRRTPAARTASAADLLHPFVRYVLQPYGSRRGERIIMAALAPDISRALGRLASALDLAPQLREDLIRRVPAGATKVSDLPEDLLWLYNKTVSEQDGGGRQRASNTRTLTLAGKPVTFSTATAVLEACDEPGLHPDDIGNGDVELPSHWRGLLVPYGVMAPDGRVIGPPPGGMPKSRQMPLPLNAQVATADGHDNAIGIGRVTKIWSQDGALWGEGEFDLGSPEGRDWAGRVGRGMAGWGSVDLDAGLAPRVESQGKDRVPRKTYGDWAFAGFTLVTRPAFDAARIAAHWDGDGEGRDDVDERDVRHPRNREMPEEVIRVVESIGMPADVEAGSGGCGCEGADDAQITFPAGGKGGLPLADRGMAWDAKTADGRVRQWAGVNGADASPEAWAKYGQGFLWHAPEASKFGDFKLPFADVVEGRLVAVPRGLFAAAGAVQGARGGVDIPDADMDSVRSKISGYYRKLKMKTPWDSKTASASMYLNEDVLIAGGEMTGTVTGFDAVGGWLRISCGNGTELVCSAEEVERSSDSLTAAIGGGPLAPDDAWFANPALTGPTPLQIDDDGRVFGHLALWGSCHTGYANTCVTAPRSMTNYASFHVGEVVTASGARLPVGKLTLGGGHAAPAAGWRAAATHYDNAGAAVAVVRAGEDSYGVWVAGAVVPEATSAQVAGLRRSPLSGDWRRIGGNLELVAALAVNVPGFPVPRPRAAIVAQRQASLVAAGVLDPAEAALADRLQTVVTTAVEHVLDSYADRRERAAAASQRIAELTACDECTCGQCDDEDDDVEV